MYRKRRIQIPKKIFLVGREKLTKEKRQKVDTLLEKYPGLKGFYWAKEKDATGVRTISKLFPHNLTKIRLGRAVG